MTIKAASSQDMRELAERLRANAATCRTCHPYAEYRANWHQLAETCDEAAFALDQAAAQRKGLEDVGTDDTIRAVAYSAFYAEKFHDDPHRTYEDRGLEIWRKIEAALHPEGKSETRENPAPYDIPESQVW